MIDSNLNYKLIRSRRRTLSIEINREANLIVKAPKWVALAEIEEFVKSKQRWIDKHRQRALEEKSEVKEFKADEQFWFLGEKYPLIIADVHTSALHFEYGFYLRPARHAKARQLFAAWYKQQARNILEERVNFFVKQFGLSYNSVKISSAQKQWGSCTGQGNLNFSWRLIMAPLFVIDYVVVHELAHLLHRNHSQRFWQKVEKWYPNYKLAEKWLNAHGHRLVI